MSRYSTQLGFTLMELLVAIVVTGVLVGIFGNFFADNIVGISRNEHQLTSDHNTRLASDSIVRHIRSSQAVELTNSIADANEPDGWTSDADTLVLATPALDTAGDPIYTDSSHSAIYSDNTIFYLQDNIIYKRTLSNTSAPGNASTTTCPPAAPEPGCPPDPKVNDTYANISINYGGSTPDQASILTITLTQSLFQNNSIYTSTLTTKTALRNK